MSGLCIKRKLQQMTAGYRARVRASSRGGGAFGKWKMEKRTMGTEPESPQDNDNLRALTVAEIKQKKKKNEKK